ncbi:MAG: hypothetical protein JNL33_17110 [Betaproteobacteria bacterium]|nr:hypothetical protein [Betaproteobacteria bacterium]MBL8535572.1 hypothetical protein [Betaproteobacteria bacterium]
METESRWRLAARVAALAAAATMAPDASALYVGMYAIGDFVSGGAGCGGGDRSSWPGMAQAWWDHMGVHGHYQGPAANRYRYIDGNMNISRFCDTSYDGDCRDHQSASPSGVDWMDAAIIATHGSDAGDHWAGTMRQSNGSISSSCEIDGGGSSNEMRVGDSYVMFLHLSSCYSADDDNLSGIPNAMRDGASTRIAHLWTGFHGLMWISSSFNGDYTDVAHDGHSSSVAYSWVTNLYRPNEFDCEWYDPWNWFGTCQDQCPIAVSVSNSGSDALTRLWNERYNFTYADPPSNSNYAYMYYGGCDPSGETTWNP